MRLTEQELLEFMAEQAYKPMTFEELKNHLELDGYGEAELKELVGRLESEGKVVRTRTNRYGIPEKMNLIRGRLQAHPKGFAFLIPDDRSHPDIYIHANDLNGAMNSDLVLVRILSRKSQDGKLEGEVARIVRRANTEIVGVFEHHESFGFVIPDDRRLFRDVFVPREKFGGAVTGQKVVVRIVKYPDARSAALEGEVIEILGHKDDPGVDILSIIRRHGLPEAFPPEVMAEAMEVPDSIREEDLAGRRDLRDRVIVTIDGEDAKDLDDAVEVVRLPNGHYRLGVHIADVGYYVKEGSALDREAYNRGCSVYLVDRVIPMLPHRLSNGICSLNPRVDRLTVSCEMVFDENGRRVSYEIYPSVIRTRERMTYTNVRRILVDRDPEVTERYRDLVGMFRLMEELALKLRERRMDRGAIDFDFPEAKVIVDENGKPIDIVKRDRTIAERIIEEFMLAANEAVAEHFHWLKVPFLYRVHEDPDPEKMMWFIEFAANFGYVVRGRGTRVHPHSLQTLLEEIEGTREETVLSTMMLRSMKQARYDHESLGHFGLAAEFYTHFTSPIRRYPDLVIHRIIREVIVDGGLSDARFERLAARMEDIARQSSERERAAVEAERETEALKKAEFMLDKIGEEFDGIISSVTSFGMFVELENTVEGLIRLSDLTDDYYHFHEEHMALIGERTSKIYRIGDEVRVRVERVNMEEHQIDFAMVDMKPRAAAPRRSEGGRKVERGRRRGEEGGRGGRGRRGGRGGDAEPAVVRVDMWGLPVTGSSGAAGEAGAGGARRQRAAKRAASGNGGPGGKGRKKKASAGTTRKRKR